MPDGLSRMYASLVDGAYDCVDRIVLNAYFRFAQSPAGSDCGGGSCMEPTASVVVIHLVADKTWTRIRTAHSAAARARFCVIAISINRPLQTDASCLK
jgi:hypothetical protein